MSKGNSTVKQESAQQPAKEKRKFVFQQYQDDAANADPSRIDDFVTSEFDFNEWDVAWIRYNNLDKAIKGRYFEVVRRSTHGHLFKDESFDSLTDQIGRGKEYLHPSLGGIAELTLCIRPAEAKMEEERQMSEASARRLEQNEKLKEIKDRMGGVVGTNVFGGVSMSHSHSGWLSK